LISSVIPAELVGGRAASVQGATQTRTPYEMKKVSATE
jgi:hypothetical protein